MFKVLEKSKENKVKMSKILNFTIIFLTVFLIVFFLATIFFWYIDFHKEIVFQIVGSLYGFTIVFKVIHHNFFQQKKAVFIGELTFKENEIDILNKIYPLEKISKIRIKGNDIKGDFRGLKSQGVNNELFLDLKSGDQLIYFFQQTIENQLKDILVLNKYVEEGKLTQLNYDSIIENTNYY